MSGIVQESWLLGDNDLALLRQVITALRRLLPLARSKDALAVVSGALETIESIRDGAGVEAAIVLSVGIQDGNAAFGEGWFARLGVGPEGIVLDKLNTTYSVELGLQRETTCFAVLKPEGGFDEAGVAAWLAEVDQLRQWSTAEIHGERHPLG